MIRLKGKDMKNLIIIFLLSISFCLQAQHRKKNRKHRRKTNKHVVVKKKQARHHRHVRPVKVRRVAHKKYNRLPARGKLITVVPTGYAVIKHQRVGYRVHKGVWYKPRGEKFVVVRAPRKARLHVLPVGHRKIVVSSRPYFYSYGNFYTQSNDNEEEYEVVDAPIGAEVDAIPEGYEVIMVDGQEYYKLDDTYYEARIDDEDKEYYIVIENPNE